MKHSILLLLTILLLSSCGGEDKKTPVQEAPKTKEVFDDSNYVLDDKFPVGDARRYGLTAENSTKIHPFTKKNRITSVIDLAEESGIEITFPQGYYNTNLTLDNRENINLRFNNSEFNLIHITQRYDTLPKPRNIKLKGTLVAYARLGITEASDIVIDSVILKSDITKNKWGLRNSGCHIYHGCDNISINYLEVQDLGSGGEKYKHSHAALALDGHQNNPIGVKIKKVYIKSSDRHGLYMTGSEHEIGEIIIDKFGVGSSKNMCGMQDADNKNGENKEFKALWINKCYDSFIEKVIINEKDSKGKYTAHFDYGDKTKPVTINSFKVLNDNPQIDILEESKTGVLVGLKE